MIWKNRHKEFVAVSHIPGNLWDVLARAQGCSSFWRVLWICTGLLTETSCTWRTFHSLCAGVHNELPLFEWKPNGSECMEFWSDSLNSCAEIQGGLESFFFDFVRLFLKQEGFQFLSEILTVWKKCLRVWEWCCYSFWGLQHERFKDVVFTNLTPRRNFTAYQCKHLKTILTEFDRRLLFERSSDISSIRGRTSNAPFSTESCFWHVS